MKKRRLLFLLLGTLFTLASCETVDIPIEEPNMYNVIYYIEEGNAYNAQSYEKNEVIDVKWWPDKEKTGDLLRNLDRYRARHLFFAGLEQKPKVSLKGEEGF